MWVEMRFIDFFWEWGIHTTSDTGWYAGRSPTFTTRPLLFSTNVYTFYTFFSRYLFAGDMPTDGS